ncbi:hypothetical protein CEXT_632751 [Caerostris extrusa]|uniref:Uncharacterized protein n=1 Tax=Caerostris extrusa TaxID=172846 RepID=A0AAV4MJJ9_CAEEX|nr:hypothetical protein CEXT_632751 [Caerostris extrusa]
MLTTAPSKWNTQTQHQSITDEQCISLTSLPNFRPLAVSRDFFFPANSQTKELEGPHSDSPIHQTIFPAGTRTRRNPILPSNGKIPELPLWS